MVKTLVIFVLAAGVAAESALAQTREFQFEVATIRPSGTINPQDTCD